MQVINDLLEPSSTNLLLREDPSRGGVVVEGVKSVEVGFVSNRTALQFLTKGVNYRTRFLTSCVSSALQSFWLGRITFSQPGFDAKQEPGSGCIFFYMQQDCHVDWFNIIPSFSGTQPNPSNRFCFVKLCQTFPLGNCMVAGLPHMTCCAGDIRRACAFTGGSG